MLENLRNVLNTMIFEYGDIHIDFGDLLIFCCVSIWICGYLIILLIIMQNRKK